MYDCFFLRLTEIAELIQHGRPFIFPQDVIIAKQNAAIRDRGTLHYFRMDV